MYTDVNVHAYGHASYLMHILDPPSSNVTERLAMSALAFLYVWIFALMVLLFIALVYQVYVQPFHIWF